MMLLLKRATVSNKALLLDELLEKVEVELFEGISQTLEHSYPALILVNSGRKIISLSRLTSRPTRGEYVDVKVNSAIHKGMPHKFYHGRAGKVWNVTKRAIGIEINKQEIKERNDKLKAEAKARGEVISMKRQPGFMVEAAAILRRSMDQEDAWVKASHQLLPLWQNLVRSQDKVGIPILISKVNQVDAARLDVEMSAMLKEQLVKVFSLMKPGFLFQYEAELDAFLEFLIWRFSIWVDKPTPGNALMNLRYRDERAVELRGKVRTGLEGPGLTVSQKLWYCIGNVGGQYLWSRLQSFSALRRWGDAEQRPLAHRVWSLLQKLEGLYKAASFSNMILFLYAGRYRNLIERVLKARLVYGSANMNRAVSFEYMNRQLVWNEFSEMLLLLLPLLNSSSFKSFLHPKSSNNIEDNLACPICQASPSIPFLALPCQHRYCYYCLRTRCAAAIAFRCSRCNEPVVAIQRHGGSVGDTNVKQQQ
ncbi:hypothetical protein QQ045_001093 [Rhodiola kirilowii]